MISIWQFPSPLFFFFWPGIFSYSCTWLLKYYQQSRGWGLGNSVQCHASLNSQKHFNLCALCCFHSYYSEYDEFRSYSICSVLGLVKTKQSGVLIEMVVSGLLICCWVSFGSAIHGLLTVSSGFMRSPDSDLHPRRPWPALIWYSSVSPGCQTQGYRRADGLIK